MANVQALILISGKRKCGKDYIARLLQKALGKDCEIAHLSTEIKREFAILNDLDFELLLTDSPYKEGYRSAMIALGEERRARNPGQYCRLATQHSTATILIVSDNRRVTDMSYFTTEYPARCLSVRVDASEEVRKGRGWKWKGGVDDAESECGLDRYTHHVTIFNERDGEIPRAEIASVVQWARRRVNP